MVNPNQQLIHNLTLDLIYAYKKIYNFRTIKVLPKDKTSLLLRRKGESFSSQVKQPGYKIPIKKEKYNLDTIRRIFHDPLVLSMESPGAGRPVIINRSGLVTPS